MRKKFSVSKSIFVSAAVVALSLGEAASADASMWKGGYVSLTFGKIDGHAEEGGTTYDVDGTAFGLTEGFSAIGYNFSASTDFVLGGELSLGHGKIDVDTVGELDLFDASLRMRAGYAVESVLIYGLVGVGGAITSNLSDEAHKGYGVQYGLGAEYLVAGKFSVRAEYVKLQYSNFEAIGTALTPPPDNVDLGVVALGVSKHF